MPGMFCYTFVRRLQVVLGMAVIGLVLAPAASSATQLDTVTVFGNAGYGPGGWAISGIDIHASSGPSGQNATGTASFTLADIEGIAGPVTCSSITGSDKGSGTPASPTTAIINVRNTNFPGGIHTLALIDNGGKGNDTIVALTSLAPRAPADCSPFTPAPSDTFTLVGRAVVFDAPTTASFTTTPSPSTVGSAVTFIASSSTCAASPCAYRWTDGTALLGTGTRLSFTFHYAGVKHVRLTVTDSSGRTSRVQHDLQVSAAPPPVTPPPTNPPSGDPPPGNPLAGSPPAGSAPSGNPPSAPAPIVIIVGAAGSPTPTPTGAPAPHSATLELLAPGRRLQIPAVLRHGGLAVAFRAPEPGRAVLRAYAGAELVATGHSKFTHATSHRVKLKLTASGKRLLEHAKRIKLTIKVYFKPTGRPGLRAHGTFTLHR